MSHAVSSRRYKHLAFQNQGFGRYIDALRDDQYNGMKDFYYASMPNTDCILFEYQVYVAELCLHDFIGSNPHAAPKHGLRACCFEEWLNIWFNAEIQEAWQCSNPSAEQRAGPRRREADRTGPSSITDDLAFGGSRISAMSVILREMEFERHGCLYRGQSDQGAGASTVDSHPPNPTAIEPALPRSDSHGGGGVDAPSQRGTSSGHHAPPADDLARRLEIHGRRSQDTGDSHGSLRQTFHQPAGRSRQKSPGDGSFGATSRSHRSTRRQQSGDLPPSPVSEVRHSRDLSPHPISQVRYSTGLSPHPISRSGSPRNSPPHPLSRTASSRSFSPHYNRQASDSFHTHSSPEHSTPSSDEDEEEEGQGGRLGALERPRPRTGQSRLTGPRRPRLGAATISPSPSLERSRGRLLHHDLSGDEMSGSRSVSAASGISGARWHSRSSSRSSRRSFRGAAGRRV